MLKDMLTAILEKINNLGARLGGIAFACAFLLCILLFLCALALCLFKRRFGYKKRALFLTPLAVIFPLLIFCVLTGGLSFSLIFLLLAECALFTIVVGVIPVKIIRVTEEERELVRFLDGKLKEREIAEKRVETTKSLDIPPPVAQPERLKCKPIERGNKSPASELDFTHVRNVIERLNAFDLSGADKRQIRDLEIYLLHAERGEGESNVKEKISEGLSALLKIMAKYGA